MKYIRKIVRQMKEEVCGAEYYAEISLEYRANGNDMWAERYKSMALDELKHSDLLHDRVTEEIDKLRKVVIPSQVMLDRWNKAHEEFIDKYDHVSLMLEG